MSSKLGVLPIVTVGGKKCMVLVQVGQDATVPIMGLAGSTNAKAKNAYLKLAQKTYTDLNGLMLIAPDNLRRDYEVEKGVFEYKVYGDLVDPETVSFKKMLFGNGGLTEIKYKKRGLVTYSVGEMAQKPVIPCGAYQGKSMCAQEKGCKWVPITSQSGECVEGPEWKEPVKKLVKAQNVVYVIEDLNEGKYLNEKNFLAIRRLIKMWDVDNEFKTKSIVCYPVADYLATYDAIKAIENQKGKSLVVNYNSQLGYKISPDASQLLGSKGLQALLKN